MGCIYKITNTVNGKAYIGQTIHDAEKGRISEHLNGKRGGNRLVRRAVEKYGKDAFTYEILHDGILPEFLNTLEIEAIAKYNTLAPNGYNLDTGGNSIGSPSEETRRKMSESNTGKQVGENHPHYGKPRSEETKRKISKAHTGRRGTMTGKKHSYKTRRKMSEAQKGTKSYWYGKSLSEETRRKLSKAHTGKTLSEEHRRKLSEARKGKKWGPLPEETKRKLSEALKGRPGKPHTPETRRKLSEAHKGKTLSPETRRKMSSSKKGKRHTPEHRRKHAEATRSPQYIPARELFFSLPSDMALKTKRRLLHQKITGVDRSTIYRWIRKWTQPR